MRIPTLRVSTKHQIPARFTHLGWLCGLAPVYARNCYHGEPEIAPRSWCPLWWFDLVRGVWEYFAFVANWDDDYPVVISGRIHRGHA